MDVVWPVLCLAFTFRGGAVKWLLGPGLFLYEGLNLSFEWWAKSGSEPTKGVGITVVGGHHRSDFQTCWANVAPSQINQRCRYSASLKVGPLQPVYCRRQKYVHRGGCSAAWALWFSELAFTRYHLRAGVNPKLNGLINRTDHISHKHWWGKLFSGSECMQLSQIRKYSFVCCLRASDTCGASVEL